MGGNNALVALVAVALHVLGKVVGGDGRVADGAPALLCELLVVVVVGLLAAAIAAARSGRGPERHAAHADVGLWREGFTIC